MVRFAASMLALVALWLCTSCPALAQSSESADEIPPLELPLPERAPGNGGGADEIPDLGDAPVDKPKAPVDLNDDTPARASDDDRRESVLDRSEPEDLFDGYEGQYEHNDQIIDDYLAPIYSSGEWFDCGAWFVDLDFILMHRTVGRGATLGIDPVNGALRPLITDNAGFRIEPGGRIKAGVFLGRDTHNRDAIIEMEYMGGFEWETGTQLTSVGGVAGLGILTALDPVFTNNALFVPTIGGFNNSTDQRFDYGADLHSLELNARLRHRLGRDRMVAMPDGSWSRQLASGMVPSYFIGLRYLSSQENLTWTSRRSDLPLDQYRGDYLIDTSNDLVGFHIGGDLRMQYKNWNGSVHGKVGSHVNFGEIRRFIQSNDPTPNRIVFNEPLINVQNDEVMAVALELGFHSAYHINPKIAIRTSYEMLWINGLALAPQQLTFETSRARIDLGGNVFYQGLTSGIEVVW